MSIARKSSPIYYEHQPRRTYEQRMAMRRAREEYEEAKRKEARVFAYIASGVGFTTALLEAGYMERTGTNAGLLIAYAFGMVLLVVGVVLLCMTGKRR